MRQILEVPVRDASYKIQVGTSLLSDTSLWQTLLNDRQVFILSDSHVAPHWLATLTNALAVEDKAQYIMPAGEHHKSIEQFSKIMDQMIQSKRRRNAVLLALGGGVVGDLGGFCAACYQRGIPVIQIPTTLLAMVDSSVGGKTAINHPAGKNMIGAFFQPEAVVADIDTLKTLSDREYFSGMAEVIKYAFVRDITFLEWLEQNAESLRHREPAALVQAIVRSCQNKSDIVVADPLEKGERALLNLGHTFAHAIETELGYGAWLHGEAVAAGMVLAFQLAEHIGRLSDSHWCIRLTRLLKLFQLPTQLPQEISVERLLEHMKLDKKNHTQAIRFILPNNEAQSEIVASVPIDAVRKVLSESCSS